MAFEYQQALFHVGFRVPNLEDAMAELNSALGITWAETVERDQPAWTPEKGSFTNSPGLPHPIRRPDVSRESREHAWLVVGDGDGVLEVRAAGPVVAAQRPSVVVDEVGVSAAGQEPRFDRDRHPGP